MLTAIVITRFLIQRFVRVFTKTELFVSLRDAQTPTLAKEAK